MAVSEVVRELVADTQADRELVADRLFREKQGESFGHHRRDSYPCQEESLHHIVDRSFQLKSALRRYYKMNLPEGLKHHNEDIAPANLDQGA